MVILIDAIDLNQFSENSKTIKDCFQLSKQLMKNRITICTYPIEIIWN